MTCKQKNKTQGGFISFLQCIFESHNVWLSIDKVGDIVVHTPQHHSSVVARVFNGWKYIGDENTLWDKPTNYSSWRSRNAQQKLGNRVSRVEPQGPGVPALQQEKGMEGLR